MKKTWFYEALNFDTNNQFSIGNAMAFAGLPNAKDRGDLIAYIKEASKWVMNEWFISLTNDYSWCFWFISIA